MSQVSSPTAIIVGGSTIQLISQQNMVGNVERGAKVTFAISLMDRDTGALATSAIDITGIAVSLQKSAGGGAFSAAGITQPTFAKATGLVSADYLFADGEWAAGDGYKLTVTGILCTIGYESATAYVAAGVWSGLVFDESDVVDDVNDIRAVLGEQNTAAATGAVGTNKTSMAYSKQLVTDVRDLLSDADDAKRSFTTGIVDSWTSAEVIVDAALNQANDYWIGYGFRLTSGFNIGEVRKITAFAGATGTITVMPPYEGLGLPGDTYELIPPAVLAQMVLGAHPNSSGVETSDVTRDPVGTVLGRIEDINQNLVGAAGIASWPNAAAPGAGVSIAEVERKIYDDQVLLQADVGDASASTKGSLYGILGNPATNSLAAVIGQLLDAALASGTADNGTQTLITLARGAIVRLGQLDAAASTGDPGTTTVITAYLKQIVNDLEGTVGIAAWPASAAPGNGVSVAEAIRKIYDDLVTLSAALAAGGTKTGTADAGSTAGMLRDAERTESDDVVNGQLLIMTGGTNAGLSSVIVDFVAATDDIFIEPDFPAVIGVGDTYTILPRSTNADILIGHNNADNAADTSAVMSNRNGSVLEREEEIADDTDSLIATAGAGTDAAVQPAVAGSLHAHVREAQENIDTVQTEVNKIGTPAGASVSADIAAVKAVDDAIKVKTDMVGANTDVSTDPSAASGTVFSKLRGIGDDTDAIYARQGAPAGASQSADVAAVKSDTGSIKTTVDTNLNATVSSRSTQASVDVIDGYHDVPGIDVGTNAQMRDVIGNKSDSNIESPSGSASVVAYLKGLLTVHGTRADAAATTVGNTASMMSYIKGILPFVGKGTGTEVAANKSLVDAIGHTGSAALGTGIDETQNVPSADVATNARLRDVVGNKGDAASSGAGTASVIALLRQLLANVAALVIVPTSTEVAGPYSYLDAGLEQTVYESTATTRRRVSLAFSNRNMTLGGTFKLYRMEDGSNYDLFDSTAVLASGNRTFAYPSFVTNQKYKLTYTEAADEGAARAIPFNRIEETLE